MEPGRERGRGDAARPRHRLRGEAPTKTRPRGHARCRRPPPATAAVSRRLPTGPERARVGARRAPLSLARPEVHAPPVVFAGVRGARGRPKTASVGAGLRWSFPHGRAAAGGPGRAAVSAPHRGGWTREGASPRRRCAHHACRRRVWAPLSPPRTVRRTPVLPAKRPPGAPPPPSAPLCGRRRRTGPAGLCVPQRGHPCPRSAAAPRSPCPRVVPCHRSPERSGGDTPSRGLSWPVAPPVAGGTDTVSSVTQLAGTGTGQGPAVPPHFGSAAGARGAVGAHGRRHCLPSSRGVRDPRGGKGQRGGTVGRAGPGGFSRWRWGEGA